MTDGTPGGTPPEDKPAGEAETRPDEKRADEPSSPDEKPPAKSPGTGQGEPVELGAGEGVVELELIGASDVGLVREHNEDSYLLLRLDDASRDPEALRKHRLGKRGTLCVVCDGMGGAAAGEVASSMAVESLGSTMLSDLAAPPPVGQIDDEKTALARKLRMAAREANAQIFREARANITRSGMGTTMTAVLFSGRHALIAQVGDSRAYTWRAGKFTQVTRDQSLVNQLLETGHITPEQAKFFEHSNVILQALGVQEEVEVQLSQVELRKGDRFILCSDGLVGVVTDEEIGAVVGACDDIAETARILIEMANGAGGPDNISVVVGHVIDGDVPAPTEADRLEYKLWKIDPELPLASAEEPITQPAILQAQQAQAQALAQGGQALATGEPAARRTRRRHRTNPTLELISMAVVFGLLLGSVMTGAVIYKHGVSCRVAARLPGLTVVSDGHDTGVRLPAAPGEDGATHVKMRLRPGHHRVTLRGQGAPEDGREIDVSRVSACEIDFTQVSESQAPENGLQNGAGEEEARSAEPASPEAERGQ
jgi:protein phosphatase